MTIFIAALVIVFFLVVFKRVIGQKRNKALVSLPIADVSFEATPEMVTEEKRIQGEILKLFEASLRDSGFVLPDKMHCLMEPIAKETEPFTRLATKAAFGGGDYLSVAEKRALGLNTRKKYARQFIECFDRSAFLKIEPKSFVEHLHLDAFHRVSRRQELAKFKKLGIKTVEILCVGDVGDCSKIKRLRKQHPIDSVPELPLAGCTAPFCRCMYVADFDD